MQEQRQGFRLDWTVINRVNSAEKRCISIIDPFTGVQRNTADPTALTLNSETERCDVNFSQVGSGLREGTEFRILRSPQFLQFLHSNWSEYQTTL